jgi:hypothetical protein
MISSMPAARVSKNQNLTRRAKQAHNDIIAKIIKPAPENPERDFCLTELKLRMRFESTELCPLQFSQI